MREAQRRRARRRRRARDTAGVVVLGLVALLAFMAPRLTEGVAGRQPPAGARAGRGLGPPIHNRYGTMVASRQIHAKLKPPVTSGLLFDVRTGRVLWARAPSRVLPIASLTKMMTALVVVSHAGLGAKVLITRDALHYSGSGVGLLPRGKRVPLRALLYGLLLPSGNDAAIALAEHVAGTQQRFIAMMNDQARSMGLRCTHFTTVSGIIDQGNHSCASVLAVLAHAVLTNRSLGPIVAAPSAVLPFPIKGGKLFLYNNNPLLRVGYPGTDGVKTGYTLAAGRCLVAAARRRRAWYGVVLLHSADPPDQAEQLLGAAFA